MPDRAPAGSGGGPDRDLDRRDGRAPKIFFAAASAAAFLLLPSVGGGTLILAGVGVAAGFGSAYPMLRRF